MKLELNDTIIRFTDETQEFDTRIIDMNAVDDAMNGIFGIMNAKNDITEINTEITVKETEITAKKAEITSKEAEITVKEADIAAKEADIAELQTQIDTYENKKEEITTVYKEKLVELANQNAHLTVYTAEELYNRMLNRLPTGLDGLDNLALQMYDVYNSAITNVNNKENPIKQEKQNEEINLATLNNELTTLNTEKTTLNNELATLNNEKAALISKKEEMLEDLQTMEEEKEEMKKNFLNTYDSTNSLILISTEEKDEASEALELLESMMEMKEEEAEAELEKQVNKVKDKDPEELANKLVEALKTGETDEPIIQDILDQLDKDKDKIGLRKNIYDRIKNNSVKSLDVDCAKYASIVIEECSKYFSTGVLGAFVHFGASPFLVGASVSIVSMAVTKVPEGINEIKNSTKSYIFLDQAKGLADGISTLISNGSITSIGAGTKAAPFGVKPVFINASANENKGEIGIDKVKIIIQVAALAGYIILAAGGLAAMLAKAKKPWDNMISLIGAKDGNDLFAALLAAGIKVAILSSLTKVEDLSSNGMGLLVPFGP